jgi:hypothetical protein
MANKAAYKSGSRNGGGRMSSSTCSNSIPKYDSVINKLKLTNFHRGNEGNDVLD